MAESVVCAVCGKPIAAGDSRLVDVRDGAKQHVHLACRTGVTPK